MIEHSQRSRSLSGRLWRGRPRRGCRDGRPRRACAAARKGTGSPLIRITRLSPPVTICGQVALHDGVLMAVVRQGLEHHVAILVALIEHEDRSAAHPVQRLADGLAMLACRNSPMSCMSRVISVGAQHSGNQAVYTFSFMSRRPCGSLQTSAPCSARPIQDVGAVDVLDVERRVLAHQDHVVIAQFGGNARAADEPRLRIVQDLERREPAAGDAVPQAKIAELGVVNLPAARPGPPVGSPSVESLAGLMVSMGSITTTSRTPEDISTTSNRS